MNKNKKRIDQDARETGISEELKLSINSYVKNSVDSNLKIYKIAAISFCSGFIFLILFGFTTKWEFIEPVASPAVWNSITHGSDEDFKKFVSKDEFYRALSEYHTDLVRTFLVPNREPIVRASEILRAGKIPIDVNVLMGGPQIEGGITRHCNKIFNNTERQVILVIPNSYEKTEYCWFDCSFGWPEIFIKLNYAGQYLDDIKLIGVRRNGGTDKIIALVTRKVAEELKMPSWENYKTNTFAKISISKVDNWTQESYLPVDPNKFINNFHDYTNSSHGDSEHSIFINEYIEEKLISENVVDVDFEEKMASSNETSEQDPERSVIATIAPVNPAEGKIDLFSQAVNSYKIGKYDNAYNVFEQAMLANPQGAKVPLILFYMGECLFNRGEYDLAILDYQKLISNHGRDPYIPKALLKQGMSFEKLTDSETAKIIYNKLIFDFPESNEAGLAAIRLKNI